MVEIMPETEIETMLNSEVLGRLGCCYRDQIYVVPINYAYDGQNIYAHSKEGLKINIMRRNSKVCFEIDRTEENGNWRSVIVYGKYEEILNVKAQKEAMKIFTGQMARLITEEHAMPSHGIVRGADKEKDPFKSVVFKIVITAKTGRYEMR